MRQQMSGAVLCAALALGTALTVRAQEGQPRSFEVASVRLTVPGTLASERVTETRVDLTNVALRNLLWMAFQINPFHAADRLSSPDWVKGVVVDVRATIPAGSTREHVPEMVKALLVERFGLRFHLEPRPRDVYELVVGPGGIRMPEAEPANDLERVFPADPSRTIAQRDDSIETLAGRVRLIRIPFGTRTITERTMYDRASSGRRTVRIDAVRMTMAELASILADTTGRPVFDRTGLTGIYRFSIELPPAAFVLPMLASAGINATADGAPIDAPTGVSALKAVEQLGLKLEPRRTPMDTIVVDHIERTPTDD